MIYWSLGTLQSPKSATTPRILTLARINEKEKKEKENLLIAAKKRTRIKIYFWQLMLVGGPVWLAVTSCAMKIDLFKFPFLLKIKSMLLLFWDLVFSYQNCSDLLWEKIDQENFWNSRLKGKNVQFFWDHYNNWLKQ